LHTRAAATSNYRRDIIRELGCDRSELLELRHRL
jgi:hypothetical protein